MALGKVMLKAASRVIVGFVLACLTAGLVTVLFVRTPVQLASVPSSAFPQQATDVAVLALLTATHTGIFAAIFALVATILAEWFSIRSSLYYAVAGGAISLLGFFAQYSSEVAGQATIFNSYAMLAYLSAGVAAGLVYWAAAGHRAGHQDDGSYVLATAADDDDRPRIIVEKSSDEIEPPRRSWAMKKAALEKLRRSGSPSTTDSAAFEDPPAQEPGPSTPVWTRSKKI